MASSLQRTIILLTLIIFLSISINVLHFHSSGEGALHHVDQEDEYVMVLNSLELADDAMIPEGYVEADLFGELNDDNMDKHDETDGENGTQEGGDDALKNNANDVSGTSSDDYRKESNAFRQIMERSASFQESCQKLPEHHLGEAKPKDFDTGVPPLPEHGVHNAMKDWLDKEAIGANERGDYPICSLPPVKSCDVDTFTLILMSHTVDDDDRLKKLRNGINNLSQWEDTGEIILVWNSAKTVLSECEKVST